jgi:hypothetical protein
MSGSFDRSGREVNYTALVYCTRDIQDKIVQAVNHSVICIFCDTAECIMVYVMVFNHMVTHCTLEISLIDYFCLYVCGMVPDIQDYQSLLTGSAIFNCVFGTI